MLILTTFYVFKKQYWYVERANLLLKEKERTLECTADSVSG